MAYTTINKSSEYFNTVYYREWYFTNIRQWIFLDYFGLKIETETSNHNLFDVVRGGYYTTEKFTKWYY
jgi:hypothetical protein